MKSVLSHSALCCVPPHSVRVSICLFISQSLFSILLVSLLQALSCNKLTNKMLCIEVQTFSFAYSLYRASKIFGQFTNKRFHSKVSLFLHFLSQNKHIKDLELISSAKVAFDRCNKVQTTGYAEEQEHQIRLKTSKRV